MLKNKRASNWIMDTMLFFLIFVALIGISVTVIAGFGYSLIMGDISIPENVEEYILMERFINSPSCFAYQDGNGRTYNKIIDMNKFGTQGQMDNCISTENTNFAFKLILGVSGNNDKFSVKTKNWLDRLNFKERQRNVQVYVNNEFKTGELAIYSQNA